MDDPSVFGDGTTNNQLIQKPANQAQQPPEQKYQNVQPVQQPNGKILTEGLLLDGPKLNQPKCNFSTFCGLYGTTSYP